MESKVTETKQNRLKSPVFWVGILTQLMTMLVAFDVIDVSQFEAIKVALVALGEVVTVFAVGNNPTNKTGF